MLDRRHFLAGTAASLLGGAAFAQSDSEQLASAGPLQMTVDGPDVVAGEQAIILPPDMEGSYAIPEQYRAQIVPIREGIPAGQIHIVPHTYNLFFTLPNNRAIRYGVAVGQEGLDWRGSATIARKVEWPRWRPTDDMIRRNPAAYERYADGMPGGPTNPLGARAIYFFQGNVDTMIRVHGTTVPSSIGTSASNGCFRMYNSHVIDLYNRTPLGTAAFVY